MAQIPPCRDRSRSIDTELRTIGMLAVLIVVAAIVAGYAWSRIADRGAGGRSGAEAVGATLTTIGRGRLVVDSIRDDGVARRAGVRVGDVLDAINGRDLPTIAAADRALRGRRVDIRIRRGMTVIDVHMDATGGMRLGQQDPADRG